MDTKKLEALAMAVRMGSFTRAAETLGYTQSGLTHMMNSLEKDIGFALLVRSRTGIRLTAAGERVFPMIQELLRASETLEGEIRRINTRREETIRVAAYASIAMHWMPEILYRFRRICPEVSVDLRMVDHALEPYELLERGETDVIFASKQSGRSCDWVPLYSDWMYAILPKDYPLNGRKAFPLQEFAGQEFLMPYGSFDLDVRAALEPVGVRVNEKICRFDDETVIRMVGRGLGVSMMSELMVRGRTDGVLCVPVDPPAKRELGMGTGARRSASGSIQQLKDCILEFIGATQGA